MTKPDQRKPHTKPRRAITTWTFQPSRDVLRAIAGHYNCPIIQTPNGDDVDLPAGLSKGEICNEALEKFMPAAEQSPQTDASATA